MGRGREFPQSVNAVIRRSPPTIAASSIRRLIVVHINRRPLHDVPSSAYAAFGIVPYPCQNASSTNVASANAPSHAAATGRLLRFRGECSPPRRALAAVWHAKGWSLRLQAISTRLEYATGTPIRPAYAGAFTDWLLYFLSFALPLPQSSHLRRSRRLSAGTTMKNVTEEVICGNEV